MAPGEQQVREPLLNFEELLRPIRGDDPAGPPSKFVELRPQFEELRREISPERAEQLKENPKDADWRGLEHATTEALNNETKDLRVAGYLLEALTKRQHFRGAHDGLKLLRLLVEQCWDRLNPPVDPEDPEVRAGPFFWLDEPERSLRYPMTIRMTPLLVGRERAFSLEEARPKDQSRLSEEAKALRTQADQAAETAATDQLQASLAEVAGSLEELDGLIKALTARLGADAPSLNNVRSTLEDCRTFLLQILAKRPAEAPKPNVEMGAAAPTVAADGAPGPGASRAEIYRRLEQAALALKELEPHSPIPYLLLRAVELGSLSFPQLMKELIRDDNSLSELKREFGIKDPPPPPES